MFCLMCQGSLKGSCKSKFKISWKASYQNCLQVSGKTIVPNIVLLISFKNGKTLLIEAVFFLPFSKAFDTMNHGLLIAKLGAYGFQEDALVFMKRYFTNRQQRVRVNSNFSMWEKYNFWSSARINTRSSTF